VAKTLGSGQEPRPPRPPHTGDWLASFQDVELFSSPAERVREQSRRSDDPTPHEEPVAEPDHAPAEAAPAITRRMRRARRSRRRAVVIAAVAAALVVCAAVATVTVVRRGGGEESSSRTSTTAATERAAITTTIAPPTTAATTPSTAPPSAAPAPGPFTVRSTCGGRACTVAVHVRSTTAAAKTGSLRNGDVVQVSCSTHGEPVGDRDTGQRSDVWYRLDSGSYVSGLYVEGPTVPDCG
jgi:hypothetical protein